MFTGLIQEVARVERKIPSGGLLRLTLRAPQTSGQVQVGR